MVTPHIVQFISWLPSKPKRERASGLGVVIVHVDHQAPGLAARAPRALTLPPQSLPPLAILVQLSGTDLCAHHSANQSCGALCRRQQFGTHMLDI